METVHYLRALGRSWFLVVIAVIAGGGGGYYVFHHATPMYRSSVRMVVAGSGDEVTSRVLAAQRAQALAQVAGTAPAVQAAATAAGYAGVAPAVIASAPTDSPFVDVRVQDTDPRRAQSIANAFAGTLPSVLVRLEGSTDTQVRVTNLSAANLPGAPYSPDKKRDIGLGLAAGLVFGVFVALLREIFNRTVRDSDELERLTGLTILGTVPRDLPKKLLPAVTDPRSARAEAYRQIRTTLLNAQARGLQTMAVTSAALGEGKTSVASNVAAVFSRAGHRVALVDADLRRPRVAAFFGLKPPYGLTEVLSGVTTLPNALNILDDGRLAILTSGRIPANPSEALGSLGMERVIAQLADEYEYVIIDTPPVLPVTDASVLAPKVDGVILVARVQHTTRDRVRRALSTLSRVSATVVGVVPNQAGKGADKDYRYPYRYTPSRRSKDRGAPEIVTTETLQRSAPPPTMREPAQVRYAPPPQAPQPEPVRYAPPAPYVPGPYQPAQYEPGPATAPVYYSGEPAEPPRFVPAQVPEPVQFPATAPPISYGQSPEPPAYRSPRQRPLNGAPHDDHPAEPAEPNGEWRPAHGYPDH